MILLYELAYGEENYIDKNNRCGVAILVKEGQRGKRKSGSKAMQGM
jgi:hypothetical protein